MRTLRDYLSGATTTASKPVQSEASKPVQSEASEPVQSEASEPVQPEVLAAPEIDSELFELFEKADLIVEDFNRMVELVTEMRVGESDDGIQELWQEVSSSLAFIIRLFSPLEEGQSGSMQPDQLLGVWQQGIKKIKGGLEAFDKSRLSDTKSTVHIREFEKMFAEINDSVLDEIQQQQEHDQISKGASALLIAVTGEESSPQLASASPATSTTVGAGETAGHGQDTAVASLAARGFAAWLSEDDEDNKDDNRLSNTDNGSSGSAGKASNLTQYTSLEEGRRQSQDSNDDQVGVSPLNAFHSPDMSLHNLPVRSTAPDWNDVIRSVTLALISSGVTGMLAYGLVNTALQQDITNISQVSLNQWELVVITFVALCITLAAIRQAFDDCTAPSVQSAPGAPGV